VISKTSQDLKPTTSREHFVCTHHCEWSYQPLVAQKFGYNLCQCVSPKSSSLEATLLNSWKQNLDHAC
jgi:hypothetical protein